MSIHSFDSLLLLCSLSLCPCDMQLVGKERFVLDTAEKACFYSCGTYQCIFQLMSNHCDFFFHSLQLKAFVLSVRT